MLEFQTQFLSSDPLSHDVDEDWAQFKQAVTNAINRNIPKALLRSQNIFLGFPVPLERR